MADTDKLEDDLDDEIYDILNLGPEKNVGSVEYKRSLLGKSKERQLELETQMRYRMEEGNGECNYIIGIDDDGTPYGLTEDEYEETRGVLDKIAKRNDYSLRLLLKSKCSRRSKDGEKIEYHAYEFLVRENNMVDYEEVKIATGGGVDSGKTSFVGTLISGQLDNGRGSSRSKVFNFKHELQSGRSSSISQQILGYQPCGKVVNHDTSIKKVSWSEIVARSSKIIKFFDLCGHTKYSKTTIKGMISNSVDYAIITVGANMGVNCSTREHIGICLTLRIPIIVILTKTDLGLRVPQQMEKTISDIKRVFSQPGSRKMIFSINGMDDVITSIKSIKGGDIVPLFKISNVSGDGLSLMHEFLNMLRPRLEFDSSSDTELHISDTFSPVGIPTVLGGFLKKGVIKTGCEYFLGPMSNGDYKRVKCRSIHVNRTQMQEASPGRYVCICVPKVERKQITSGMVLVSTKEQCIAVKRFTAEVVVYRTHATTIRVGYETMVHANSIRSVAKLIQIREKKKIKLKKSVESLDVSDTEDDNTSLSLGDRAIIKLEFRHKPHYLSVGDRILLSETHIKMCGKILELNPE